MVRGWLVKPTLKPVRKGTVYERQWQDADKKIREVSKPDHRWDEVCREVRSLVARRLGDVEGRGFARIEGIEWYDDRWNLTVRAPSGAMIDEENGRGVYFNAETDFALFPPPVGSDLLTAVEVLVDQIVEFSEACFKACRRVKNAHELIKAHDARAREGGS